MSDLQHFPVPTLRELVERGDERFVRPLAWTKDGAPTMFRVTDEGHAYLGMIMKSNALLDIARGIGDWERPVGQPPIGGGSRAS